VYKLLKIQTVLSSVDVMQLGGLRSVIMQLKYLHIIIIAQSSGLSINLCGNGTFQISVEVFVSITN
jgi:hypothetical protein